MIIDHHNHLWVGTATGEGFLDTAMTVDALLADMDKGGVDIAGVCSVAQDMQNDYVLASQRAHQDRIFGYCFVNPRDKNAAETLQRYLGEGLKGLKLHPRLHGYPLDAMGLVGPVLEVCQEHGVPVFVHGAGAEEFNLPYQFEEIARAFPELPIILGHSGASNMVDAAVRAAQRNPNVYLDTSYCVLDAVKTVLRHVSPDRVLMSTDWPGSDFRLEQFKIDLATENMPEARPLLVGQNYARLARMQL